MAICFRAASVVWLSCRSSLTPRMLVSGLFNSWATPADHRSHGGQAFALDRPAARTSFPVVMSRTEMMTPASLESASKNWLAVARIVRPPPSLRRDPIFRGSKSFAACKHITVKLQQFGRVTLSLGNLFTQQFFGRALEQLTNPGTHEGITLLQIDHQNEIGKTLQQAAAEFFLARHLALKFAPLGDVHQTCPDNESTFPRHPILRERIPEIRQRFHPSCGA